jgi:hypothetical protein
VDELPLFVRAGALLPLLSPDVDTLADHGKGVVHLADRAGRLRLLAFPRGHSQARIYDRERVRSHLTGRMWTLTLSQARTRRLSIEAVLPWRACGRGVSVRAGVTRLTARMRSGAIRVHRCT